MMRNIYSLIDSFSIAGYSTTQHSRVRVLKSRAQQDVVRHESVQMCLRSCKSQLHTRYDKEEAMCEELWSCAIFTKRKDVEELSMLSSLELRVMVLRNPISSKVQLCF